MPILRKEDAPVEPADSSDVDPVLGPYKAYLLSDGGGLSQFGARIEYLPPGSQSSRKHWHEHEDEFIFMLEGVVTLIEGDAELRFSAGEAATFRAGDPVGHCLVNQSGEEAVYLVVGTRAASEVVWYTDEDLVLRREGERRTMTDWNGNPKS